MTDVVEVKDSSPFSSSLSDNDEAWLRRLSKQQIDPLVIRVGSRSRAMVDEPVVRSDARGQWWAGRYVGTLTFEGRELRILPRFGFSALEDWLAEVMNVIAAPVRGDHLSSQAFLLRVLAAIWGTAFVEAARHGVPSLRRTREHAGASVRGRLDVRRTQARFASGRPELISHDRAKSLDNPIARTIVLAHQALKTPLLRNDIPEEAWLPERGRDLLPAMRNACGSRPALPDRRSLQRIRYTPITASYRPFVRLSYRIARRRGWLTSQSGTQKTFGALIDVAELWELFVARCAQRAANGVGLRIIQGKRGETQWSVASNASGKKLANIIPDILVSDQRGQRIVIDAKYKSLRPTRERRRGFAQADLYQIIAYMNKFGVNGSLAYPLPEAGEYPPVLDGPWQTGSGHWLTFFAVHTSRQEAREGLREYLEKATQIDS